MSVSSEQRYEQESDEFFDADEHVHRNDGRSSSDFDTFIAEVRRVREEGDILDAVHPLQSSRKAVKGNLFVAGLVGEAAMTVDDAPLMGMVAGTAVIAGKATWDYFKRQRIDKKCAARTSDNGITETKEVYELYRVKDELTGSDEVVMRWYGSLGAWPDLSGRRRTASESLEHLADMADAGDVRAVLISQHVLGAKAVAGKRLAIAEFPVAPWIASAKGVEVVHSRGDTKIEPTLLSFTPGALRRLSTEMVDREIQPKQLDAIIELLCACSPGHPLTRTYDMYGGRPEKVKTQLTATARQCLEMKLDDATVQGPRTVRHKVPLSSTVSEEIVRWQSTGNDFGAYHGSKKLHDALGMGPEKMHDILANPKLYSHREITAAAECAVYLEDYEIQRPSTDEKAQHIEPQGYTFQAQVAASIRNSGSKQRLDWRYPPLEVGTKRALNKRRAAIGGLFVVACAGLVGTETAMEHWRDTIFASAERAYADPRGKQVDDLNDSQLDRIHERALDDNDLLQGYFTLQGPVERFVERFEPDLSGQGEGEDGPTQVSGAMSGLSGLSGRVGNVLPPEDGVGRTEWVVEATPGLSTEGYWATATGNALSNTGYWSREGHEQVDPVVLPTDIPDPFGQYMEVSREFAPGEVVGKPVEDKDDFKFTIPVLEGYKPVAATYGGRNVYMHASSDGTFELSLGKLSRSIVNQQQELTYWLAPDSTQTGPRMFQFARVSVDGPNDEIEKSIDIWDQALSTTFDNHYERGRAMVEHVREEFSYADEPLPRGTATALQAGEMPLDRLVQEQLEIGEANCNVASTIVAIGAPHLNIARGYQNDGNGALSAGEAHMWLVDSSGNDYDPTPPRRAESISIGGSGIGPDGKAAVEILSWMALAGLSLTARRRTGRWRADKRLNLYDTSTLASAKQVADTASYAARFDVNQLKLVPQEMSRGEAIRQLARHQVHSSHVSISLAKALETAASRKERRLLRRAQRIIHTVRRAGLAVPVHDPGDLSGLFRTGTTS